MMLKMFHKPAISVLKRCAQLTSTKASEPSLYRSGAFADSIENVSEVNEQQKNLLNNMYLSSKPQMTSSDMKEDVNKLANSGLVKLIGKSGQFCDLTTLGRLLSPVDAEVYFKKHPDPMLRSVNVSFDKSLIEIISKVTSVFDGKELTFLDKLRSEYQANKSKLSPEAFKREHQRVIVDYIWKSSNLEGNTYTLMETENLLFERVTQKGNLDDVLMIVDHKAALDEVYASLDSFKGLDFDSVKRVHSLLTHYLPIPQGIRNVPVGIGGCRYQPPADRMSIESVLPAVLAAINGQGNPYSAALVSTVLFSYLQAFCDGNKRTSRMIGNGIMLAHDLYPLTYRMIDKDRYLEALMLFYERGNVGAFKEIFLQQAEYSAVHYYNLKGPE